MIQSLLTDPNTLRRVNMAFTNVPSQSHPPPPILLTSSLHHLVELALDVQLWVFGLHTFQLNGHLLARGNVGT